MLTEETGEFKNKVVATTTRAAAAAATTTTTKRGINKGNVGKHILDSNFREWVVAMPPTCLCLLQ